MSTLSRLEARVVGPLVGAGFVAFWVVAEASRAMPIPGGPPVVLVGLWWWLALYGMAIALSGRWPVVALGIVGAVPILQLIGVLSPPESTNWPVYAASLYVIFVVARAGSRRAATSALVVGAVQSLAIGVAMALVGDWQSWVGMASPLTPSGGNRVQWAAIIGIASCLLTASAWLLGYVLKVQASRAADRLRLDEMGAELLEAEFELRSVQERSAIAQEVHDVLAHSLAVVIAVADGSRFLQATSPGNTNEALREIADAARSALVDLRGLMEELTESTARPQPSLDDLDELRHRMAAAGVVVSIEEFGERSQLRPGQELSVYRILQEGLTNVLKHAGSHPVATVALDWRGTGLSLVIRSSGEAVAVPPDGSGAARGRSFGISGMEDRARLAGGWLTAEREAEGAFVVTAFIPVAADATAGSASERPEGNAEVTA